MYQQEYNQSTAESPQRLTPFEQQKVVDHLKLVKWVVLRIVDRLPKHIDAEDLMHSGMLGLIDAVQRFVWGREKEAEEFRAYAECRIRGQVMDDLRQQDILSRSARDRVNQFKKINFELQKKFNREPTHQEIADAMQIDLETCHQLRAEASGGRQVPLDDPNGSPDAMQNILKKALNLINPHTPEGMMHIKEVRQILADEIEKLGDRERKIVSMYYLEEMTLKEIAVVLNITESRVSQIHAQSLGKLLHRIRVSFDLELKDAEDI